VKIILPVIKTIEKTVSLAREKVLSDSIFSIYDLLNDTQKEKLNDIIEIDFLQKKTKLSWLREIPGKSSSRTFNEIADRIEYIHSLELQNIDLDNIHNNRIEELYKLGSKYEAYDFKRFNAEKRYSILSIYLINFCKKLIDQAIQIHDIQIQSVQSFGKKEQENLMKKNGKKANITLHNYVELGRAIIKAKEEGKPAVDFKTIEDVMPWDEFVISINEVSEITRPKEYNSLDLITQKYSALRRYTPRLLKILEFKASKTGEPVLKALETIKELNSKTKKKVPKGAPLDFVNKQWEKYVYDQEGNIDKKYYELAAFTELKNAIRSGDISIVGSKQHKPFEEYLMTKEEWEKYKVENTDFKVPLNAEEYLKSRLELLNSKFKYVSDNIKTLKGVSIENNKFVLLRLEKAVPDEAKKLSSKLYSLMPRVNLSDIIIDICKYTSFDKKLTHASTTKEPKENERACVTAALMALGTNIGLKKMEQAVKGLTYKQISNAANWRMSDDNMEKAMTDIINCQHKQPYAKYWGDGSTSSSDGVRVKSAIEALNASYNPHYGLEKGVTMYSAVSDQYSRFGIGIINTNSRDAIHIVNILLNHKTELEIEEHYTDTAGYTDQVFGLTHLLGFRFAPRLRNISDCKLYYIEKKEDFKNIQEVIKGKINTKIIKENYDDILRLAYSIKEGKVSGSLIMGKLGSYARQNSLAKALSELGKIEKTIFILDYLSDEDFRRKIQIGLNKGEAMNALARAIFFGKYGILHEKDIQGQLQRATALSIIINAITLWNTIYLPKVVEKLKEKEEVKEDFLKHVSPLGWEHINFIGQYNFDDNSDYDLVDNMRPLKAI
jgi:TnpA family transposase